MSGCSRRLKADQLGSTSPSTRNGIDVNGITLPSRRRCQRWSARPGPRRAGVLLRTAKERIGYLTLRGDVTERLRAHREESAIWHSWVDVLLESAVWLLASAGM